MSCGVRLAGVQEPLDEAEPSSLCLTSMFILHRSAAEHPSLCFWKSTLLHSTPADLLQSSPFIYRSLLSQIHPMSKKQKQKNPQPSYSGCRSDNYHEQHLILLSVLGALEEPI